MRVQKGFKDGLWLEYVHVSLVIQESDGIQIKTPVEDIPHTQNFMI